MEVLIELNQVPPVRVLLQFACATVHRPPSGGVPQENAGQPAADFLRNLVQVHLLSAARWTLDGKAIAVIAVILQQRTNEQRIDGHPNRSAPIRIAAEHAGVGLAR